jgi:hypothetical protein
LSRSIPHVDTPVLRSILVFDPVLAWSNDCSDSFSGIAWHSASRLPVQQIHPEFGDYFEA